MYHHHRCESLLYFFAAFLIPWPRRHSTLCSTENTEVEVDMIMKLKGGDGWGEVDIFLGGGFKCLFSPLLGEMIQFD